MVTTFADQGIETVFEGIEEGWQLQLAENSGASMVQGYALARPELAPTSFSAFRPPAHRRPVVAVAVDHAPGKPIPSIVPCRQALRKKGMIARAPNALRSFR